jgi:hypothetical protein
MDVRETMPRQARELADAAERAASSKPISTLAHGILDYTLGPALTFMPQVFGFKRSGKSTVVPRAYGAAAMAYSTMTKYELGLYPVVPMKTHLMIDAASGAFLAASPWLLGFGKARRKRTWLPHLLFAAAEIAIVALSDSRSKQTLLSRE